ncbi:MAG TPA: HAD-IA family hydrolase [Candidatus Limnocylindria bacterium]|nr:HAD-IA family hydrolase [Candidatus Limnocylindria bacterium]
MTNPVRAVFLDVGETLMRPNPSWEHVYAGVFTDWGVPVEMAELQVALHAVYQSGGYGFDGSVEPSPEQSHRRLVEMDKWAFDQIGLDPMPDGFFEDLAARFQDPATWQVFADVRPAMEGLRSRGLILGVVSNWAWQLPELLDGLGLGPMLDFVAASARIGYDKPHPGIFQWALDRAGVPSETVVHVGDHLDADVAGARGVGIDAVLVDRRGRYDPPPDGVPVVTSLEGLLPLIDARLA